ncbi:hypothetical protein GS489_33680 [Rhodococcus hoagii]|nr:hypothetical protein [Prescottella equi]
MASLTLVVGGTLSRGRRPVACPAAPALRRDPTARNPEIGLLEDTRTQRGGRGCRARGRRRPRRDGRVLHVQGLDAFRGNLEAKYGYTAVDRIRQSGPGFVADLTQADGTVLRDEMVLLESSGEPVVGEDIFARPVETR